MAAELGVNYGRGKAAALRQAVHELLLEHEQSGELPTSNRFLFYELVQRGKLDKSKTRARGRGADQDLSDASKWLRDEGFVPWGWIVDERRSLTQWEYANTLAEYLIEAADHARIDCWGDTPPPLIVCESATFGGVLGRSLAPEYLCPITATNGQVGGFLHTNVAPLLQGNDCRVLYVGDLDDQGRDIEENTRAVLVRLAGRRKWRRVALTPAQVKTYNLPAIPKVARRYSPPRVGEAVEVEALGQGVVTGLVQQVLDELLPKPLEAVQVRQQAERHEWAERVRRLWAQLLWEAGS